MAEILQEVARIAERQAEVLIVDDEKPIREILKQRLITEGFYCQEAASAHETLKKLREHNIGLVVLDIKMPDRSGVDLLPEIRAAHPDTVVIMATAVDDKNVVIDCMRRGAYDYITKPFNLDEFMISVKRALQKRQLELENKEYQHCLEQRVEEQSQKIRHAFLKAVAALANALEAKDEYTHGHSERVAAIAVAVARELGLPNQSINRIRFAGLIHDIGKIGVKESVLNKPGRLTEEEFRHIMRHCQIGERILNPVVEDEGMLDVVKHHHERCDGNGYPDGLNGANISLEAKILTVADAYDAMVSVRPYRPALPLSKAIEEIKKGLGTQFDPAVGKALLQVLKAGELH